MSLNPRANGMSCPALQPRHRCESGEPRGLVRLEGADLGHLGEGKGGGDGGDAGDAGEDAGLAGEAGVSGDRRVDLGDGVLRGALRPPRLTADEGVDCLLGEGGLGGGRRCFGGGLEEGSHAGEHGGVDPIGLGEVAGGFGEAPRPNGVRAGEGQAGAGDLEGAVVAAGRLEGDAGNVAADPADQPGVATGVVGNPEISPPGQP